MSALEDITIIGAGLIGQGIAQVFATHGHSVRLFETNNSILTEAPDRIRANLEIVHYVKRGVLATNAQLVEKVVRLAHKFEREVATPDEARAILNLKGYNAINS